MAIREEWSWIRKSKLFEGCEERRYSGGFRAMIRISDVFASGFSCVYVFREDEKNVKHLRRTFTQIGLMDIRYTTIDRRMADRGVGDRLFCKFSK